MISNAFKGAYQNEVSQQNSGIGTITQGVTDAATVVLGAMGFAGKLGNGIVEQAGEHALANRIGGIGGNIMLATIQEKVESAKANEKRKMFSRDEISNTINNTLGDNPINNKARKELGTVFEILQKAKETNILNNNGKIDSSIGEVDPNSDLGKKILDQVGGNK